MPAEQEMGGMGVLEFIASVVGSTAWPIAIAAALFFYRARINEVLREFAQFIARMKMFKYGDLEAGAIDANIAAKESAAKDLSEEASEADTAEERARLVEEVAKLSQEVGELRALRAASMSAPNALSVTAAVPAVISPYPTSSLIKRLVEEIGPEVLIATGWDLDRVQVLVESTIGGVMPGLRPPVGILDYRGVQTLIMAGILEPTMRPTASGIARMRRFAERLALSSTTATSDTSSSPPSHG